ncbi:helix-turn-helix domain-containing protein [Streptomyces sp. NPDC087428]|uniref:helix-turn-helix domain-containing protein n=1 Tax=Streptomyces sp. NPDC087428 TaxID=3365788 RepID=UPI0038041691
MPVCAARPTGLTASERARPKKAAYGHKTECRLRVRAQVVLHAARARSNARIARGTGLHLDAARTWRVRFAERVLAGLSDRRRSGRPPSFTALQVAGIEAPACRFPAETGTPLSRRSCSELPREVATKAIAGSISASIDSGEPRAPDSGPGSGDTFEGRDRAVLGHMAAKASSMALHVASRSSSVTAEGTNQQAMP